MYQNQVMMNQIEKLKNTVYKQNQLIGTVREKYSVFCKDLTYENQVLKTNISELEYHNEHNKILIQEGEEMKDSFLQEIQQLARLYEISQNELYNSRLFIDELMREKFKALDSKCIFANLS